MSISSLFQFIIGFFLGIIFFSAGIAGAAYLFFHNVSSNPDKHIFAEEKSSPTETETVSKINQETQPAQTNTIEDKKPEKTSIKTQSDKPQSDIEAKLDTEELPPGAYFARVTWSTGLSLRAEPSKNAQRVGGIGYNTKIIILETSDDGRWQKMRFPKSGQEAWIKAGNVAKVTDDYTTLISITGVSIERNYICLFSIALLIFKLLYEMER